MMELARERYEDLTDEGFDLRDDYSGRGMYGKTCLGLTGSVEDLVRFVMKITDEDDAWYTTDNSWLTWISTDSMGRDTIFYWPRVTVATE